MPFVRRVIDYRGGTFNSLPIFSLIPYVMLLPLAILALRSDRLARVTNTFKLLALVWLATFTYGLLVGFANGNFAAALFSFIQYTLPMSVGLWLAGQPVEISMGLRRVSIILLIYGSIVAFYGIAQYINPPPWDVNWVLLSDFTSSGAPEPFSMRIFSTLNSTGPCADFLAIVIIMSLRFFRLRGLWVLPISAALAAALLLTLVRASWIAMVLGMIVYLILSPRRLNTFPILGVFAFALIVMISGLPKYLGADSRTTAVVDRISTFNDINGDASAVERQDAMGQAAEHSLLNPLGDGLGTLGSSARLSANGGLLGTTLDSGYFSRLIELGWIGFTGYCFVLFGGVVAIFNAPAKLRRRNDQDFKVAVAMCTAVSVALIWLDAAGDSHYGVDAIFFWISMSVCGSLPMHCLPAQTKRNAARL